VLEPHLALHRWQRRRRGGIRRLLLDVEHLEHALARGDPGLHHRGELGELAQLLGELPRVLDERLDVTDRHRARHEAQATDHRDRDIREVADEAHRRHDHARQELSAERRIVQLVVLDAEPGLDLAPPAEHLDERVPGERLLDLAVERAEVLPLGGEPTLRAPSDPRRHRHRERYGHQRDDREQRRDHHQHGERAGHQHQRTEHRADGLLQAGRDVVDVVRDPAEQLTVRVDIEVRQRQPAQLGLDLGTQRAHHALDDAVQDPAGDPGRHRRGHVDPQDDHEQVAELREVDAGARLARPPRAVHDQVEDRAEHHRRSDREPGAHDREHEHHAEPAALRPQQADDAARRALEVLGLLRWSTADRAERPTLGRRACRGRVGRRGPCVRAAGGGRHAVSSS